MAKYKVNRAAVRHCRDLIEAGKVVLDSEWGDVQPDADAENAFLEEHGWDDYPKWFLGLTEGANDETKARHAFVYGDFTQGAPQRADRVRLPRRGVAAQGRRAGRPPAAAGAGQGAPAAASDD